VSLVSFELVGYVAVIRLNRPEKYNSLNPEMAVRLAQAWERIKADNDIRVAVITGTGKAFCAGGDLGTLIPILNGSKKPVDEWEKALSDDRTLLTKALLRDIDVGKPVIAAINGDAVAGGMELVLGTDIRVAVKGARLGLQEVKHGVFPGGGGSVRLPAQLPQPIALEMLTTGSLMSSDKLASYGLINHVVDTDEVIDRATKIAVSIAENAPLAVQAVRKSARESIGNDEQTALKRETDISKPIWRSDDAKEGPRAFLEKRAPTFFGR